MAVFCLPFINICLKSPHLSDIAAEISRTYDKLADPYLTDCNDQVNDINFILGIK